MSVPTSYTEADLKAFVHTTLGATATALGWSVAGGSYDETVNETLLAYGQTDISQISGTANIRKVRALARLMAWRAAVAGLAGYNDIRDGQTALSLSQLQAQALNALRQAEADAAQYDDSYRVGVDKVTYIHDPYTYLPDEARVR